MATKQSGGDQPPPGDGGNGTRAGEFRGGGEVRTALIQGETFGIKAVQYVVVDGLAMFEGDIVLGTVEEVERISEMLRAETASGVAHSVQISGNQFRWPNCRIPFTIDPALSNQARVTNAIAHWEANTNYRFIPRTTEADYVTFRPGSGCSAQVGRRSGQQFVNLASTCSLGNTIHEIGHVIGLWHEQSREDRDSFVRINWNKITPGFEHNFNQHITDGDDVGGYDFGSIMHYPLNAFSVDGSNTITPIAAVPAGVTVGQRSSLSAGDIAAANSHCPRITLKEAVKDVTHDTIKEQILDTRKEQILDTRKEAIKDLRLDTRKEQIRDTIKEQIRDTIKEGAFDPGPTLAENVTTPGLPGIRVNPAIGGVVPFAVAISGSGADIGANAGGGRETAAAIDQQLAEFAEQLAQLDAARANLQAQYDQTAALLDALLREDDANPGSGSAP